MATMMLASFATTIMTILLVGVSLLLIGLVLIQKNRGSGLSGAFGGVGGHTAFGTKTGDFLTWVTVGFTALFLLLSITGVFVFEPDKPIPPPSRTMTPAGGVEVSPGEGAEPFIQFETTGDSEAKPIELVPLSSPPEGFEKLELPPPAPSPDSQP